MPRWYWRLNVPRSRVVAAPVGDRHSTSKEVVIVGFEGAHALGEGKGEGVARTSRDEPDSSGSYGPASVDPELESGRGPVQLHAQRGGDLIECADVEQEFDRYACGSRSWLTRC